MRCGARWAVIAPQFNVPERHRRLGPSVFVDRICRGGCGQAANHGFGSFDYFPARRRWFVVSTAPVAQLDRAAVS